MKKIRQIMLSLACAALVFPLNAQKQYRLQAVTITLAKAPSYTAEFMMPPSTRLGKKNKRSVNYNPKFKYHRVLIKGLGKGYFTNLKSLDNAAYAWDDQAISRELLADFDIKDTDKIDVEGNGSVIIYYNSKNFSSLVIELDYSKLLTGPDEEKLTEKFEQMHVNVIREMSELENNAAFGFWAKTTAAEINKKLNELLPEPHKAVTGRYGSKQTDAHSFIMLGPDIKLKVDVVDKNAESGKWSYRLNNTIDISILRNNAGLVVQSPYLQFSSGVMPPNYTTNPAADRGLQASSADIQLSDATKTSNYIFLYQEQFKRNNSESKTGSDACPALADADLIQCNAFLIHTNEPAKVYPHLESGDIDGRTSEVQAIVKSAFGPRNLILPYITIKVNGQSEELMLTTTLAQFTQKHSLPRRFDLLRKYNGRYRSVKYKDANPNQSPLLLAGDIIIYKP